MPIEVLVSSIARRAGSTMPASTIGPPTSAPASTSVPYLDVASPGSPPAPTPTRARRGPSKCGGAVRSSAVFGALLDKSLVFSFDRTGYARHARAFAPADLAVDLTGRVVLVTGAGGGLGLAAARALAALGASVGVLVRDATRGEAARAAVEAHAGRGRTFVELLDVASRASIDAFAARWSARPIDVLVHNAGVLPLAREHVPDGLERAWATNVVGPQRLTHALAPALAAATAPRVIWVSSGGMYGRRVALDELVAPRESYDGVVTYALTKRAQVILAGAWAARDPHAWHASMHPGWADTPGVQGSLPTFRSLTRTILRTPEMGADTIVWLAARAQIPGPSGRFWFDRREAPLHLGAWSRDTREDRANLWRTVCQAAGLPDLPFPGDASR
jgi:dehydrogenase/reductase SDR family protein 12